MTSFYPDLPTAAGLAAALVVMVCVPGWALLSVAGRLGQWSTLQKWALAVGLSLSLYPVALYWLRSAPAWVKLGRWELIGVLALAAGVIAWRHWPPRRPAFSGSGAIALLVVAGTLATRFWIIRDQPFPASPDSLHHTLLTQLTAVAGRLPQTLEPYFPIPLALYHLGLYALSGPAQILSGAPAHTALLWTAQLLNGLSGVGVFLLLDRRIDRLSAILGTVVVGLWSFQPAWLVSWGRFTPVAAQTVLPFAWLLTWQALEAGRQAEWTGRSAVRLIGLAGLTNAAVFLLHFRVAVYLLPLLAMTAIVELWRAHRAGALRRSALILGGVAGASLVLAAPAVWDALSAYYSLRSASWTATQSLEAVEAWRQG